MAGHELCQLSVGDGIASLVLKDAPRQNALSEEMMASIVGAVEKINARDDIGCVIITGAGEAFSAGGDVHAMANREGLFGLPPVEVRQAYLDGVHQMPLAISSIGVPTIAAVNGHAIGGGCDLAVMCDIRIASGKAVFAESFLRVGLISGDGGAWFLPRVVGMSRAMEMAFTCDFIGATEAERIGLVSRVVPHGELDAEARKLAGRIAGKPREALRLTKRLMRFAAEAGLEDTLELSASMQGLLQNSDEHRKAVENLVMKMKANRKSRSGE